MAKLPKDKEREQLEREIEGKEYRELLQQLQREHSLFREFSNWGRVVAFMRNGHSRDPIKDEILRPILAAHAKTGDYRCRAILLVFFWPGLKSISLQRIGWDPEFEELWAKTVWAFLETVCRLDLAKRPDRLVQKLVNDTTWRLGYEYRRDRRRAEMEVPTDPEHIECLADGCEDTGPRELELREERDLLTEPFRNHLEAGRISETDFNLIVGTRIYGRPLQDCAEEYGLTYQAAKKRRQRAEAAIRRFEESS